MRAMLLRAQHESLDLAELPSPEPGRGEVLLRVHACAVWRTDLHIAGRELTEPKLPLSLGHQIVGSAAHMITQVARYQGQRVFAFTRPGDRETQAFALELGAEWAGGSGDRPPEQLDAAIIFASAGELVPAALRVTAKGGTVVCGG